MAFVGGACSEQRLAELLLAACDEIEKLRARSIDDTNLHLYNDLELSRLEIAKLQKRAEDWEQKDVVAFEKTIADLREKLTAAEREKGEAVATLLRIGEESSDDHVNAILRAEKAERERDEALASYAVARRATAERVALWQKRVDEASELHAEIGRLREQLAEAESQRDGWMASCKVPASDLREQIATLSSENGKLRAEVEYHQGVSDARDDEVDRLTKP